MCESDLFPAVQSSTWVSFVVLKQTVAWDNARTGFPSSHLHRSQAGTLVSWLSASFRPVLIKPHTLNVCLILP